MSSRTRIWILVCAVAAVAVLAGGWFIGVQPQLASADTANASAAQVDAHNQQTGVRLAALTKLAAKTETMRTENQALLISVPRILKPNRFIRRAAVVAALDGASVVSVTLGDSVAYSTPPSAAAGAAATGTQLAKTDPLITPANFTVVPANITVTGGADTVTQFVHDIQNDQRTFDVTGLQLSKDDESAKVTAALTGYVYTLNR